MSSSSIDWDQLFWQMIYSLPSFIAWCIAIFYCMTRRRENPKGAVYLGLAVLVSLVSTLVAYTSSYLLIWTNSFGFFGGIQYLMVGFHACGTITFWILVIMAVFARPTHYDYIGGSAIEDELQ